MRISVETEIAAPRETVYDIVTSIARWPQIMSAIEGVEIVTPGPVRAGTRFRETRRMFGREATEEMTVAELDPPGRFVLTAENHGTRYRADHILEAVPRGTKLTMRFEGTPVTLWARLFAPMGFLMIGAVRGQLASDLADIKRAAEVK